MANKGTKRTSHFYFFGGRGEEQNCMKAAHVNQDESEK